MSLFGRKYLSCLLWPVGKIGEDPDCFQLHDPDFLTGVIELQHLADDLQDVSLQDLFNGRLLMPTNDSPDGYHQDKLINLRERAVHQSVQKELSPRDLCLTHL